MIPKLTNLFLTPNPAWQQSGWKNCPMGPNYISKDSINNKISCNPNTELQTKIKKNNLWVSKAGTGNCIIIMNKEDYVEKENNFLNTDTFNILRKDSTPNFMSVLDLNLEDTSNTLTFFETNKSYVIPMNPSTPRLYGLPKIHKLHCLIFLVVSFINSLCHQ